MTKGNKRPPAEKPVSLHPLDFETALGALLETGPHPRDDEPKKPKPDTTKGRE